MDILKTEFVHPINWLAVYYKFSVQVSELKNLAECFQLCQKNGWFSLLLGTSGSIIFLSLGLKKIYYFILISWSWKYKLLRAKIVFK